MKQAGKTQDSVQAESWLTMVTMVNECGIAFGGGGWLWCRIQQKQSSLIATSSWDTKLKPSKASLNFTNNIGTQAQKAIPMTRKSISWA